MERKLLEVAREMLCNFFGYLNLPDRLRQLSTQHSETLEVRKRTRLNRPIGGTRSRERFENCSEHEASRLPTVYSAELSRAV